MTISETVIPSAWPVERIGDHYEVRKRPKGLRIANSDVVPFVPMDGIPAGGHGVPRFELRNYGALTSGVYFEAGDILLSRITPSFENGKQAIASPLPSGFGFGSTEIIPLYPTDHETDALYLFYALLHPSIRKHLVTRMEGATGRQRVPDKSALDLAIPFPPRNEQRRVSAALKVVQQALDTETHRSVVLAELKRAAMAHLFTHGLRREPLKETEIGLVPESWEVTTLGRLCEKPEYGFTESAQREPVGPQFLRITDITERGVAWNNVPYCRCPEQELVRKRLVEGDIVVARIGATTGKNFRVVKPPTAVFASYLIRLRARQGLDSRYLSQWMQSTGYWEQINAQKDANLKGGVNSTTLSSLTMPLPGSAEQADIAEQLEAIDDAQSITGRKVKALSDLFNSLLDGLMTGALSVPSLDDLPQTEVAGAL